MEKDVNLSSEPVKVAEVLGDELEEILRERKLRLEKPGMSSAEKEELTEFPVGLALSGGGIRSATLSLGVLQYLSQNGKDSAHKSEETAGDLPLIEHIDYLSTVSGGGYIGSWFVANRLNQSKPASGDQTSKPEKNDFILKKDSPELGHLRRFSRYLAPEGGLMSADSWTMAAVWFRNTALIQAMVFCALAAVFLLARYWGIAVMSGAPDWGPGESAEVSQSPARFWGIGFMLSVLGLLGYAAYHIKKELEIFNKDDVKTNQPEKMSGEEKSLLTKEQPWVQRHIVIPTILSSLVLALGMWWRHQSKATRIEATEFWSLRWWGELLEGREPQLIAEDPLIWAMCLIIGGMAVSLVRTVTTESEPYKNRVSALVFVGVVAANVLMMYSVDKLFFNLKCGAKFPAYTLGLDQTWIKLGDYLLKCHPREEIPDPLLMVPFGGALAAVIGPALIICCYTLVVVLGLGLMGRHMPDKVREWWSRLGAWLMIYGVVFLLVTGLAIWSPLLVEWIRHMFQGWISTGLLSGWLGALASSVILGKSKKTSGTQDSNGLGIPLGLLTFVAVSGLLVAAAWTVRFMLTPESASGEPDPFLIGPAFDLGWHLGVTLAVLLVGAALVWRVDINEFSMNQFYRNRLVRCYLGAARTARRYHKFTGFDFKDDVPLRLFVTQAKTEHPVPFCGPYPLVCAALNTSQGGDLDVQERKAKSFLFSPLYCGSFRKKIDKESTLSDGVSDQGYRPTDEFMVEEKVLVGPEANVPRKAPVEKGEGTQGKVDRDLSVSLGTAISISGAAASPNSGYHTSPLMAFLLTVFNARLGAWMANPAREQWRLKSPALLGLGHLRYLSAELFGCATPSSPFVYVSDGGHFENLGIYELIRRRCRLIIVVDGEQDALYSFHALGTAIRRCRVDFQTEIEINVSDIKPSLETGLSRNHGAVGKITYPEAKDKEGKALPREGVLVYLKSSLTGDEETDIRQYAALSPLFPHESTGDQFFSESQFESYRSLGWHMAEDIFGGAMKRRRSEKNPRNTNLVTFLSNELTERWFRPSRVPSRSFVDHTRTLDALWKDLSTPGLPACLGEMVFTEWKSFQNALISPVAGPILGASANPPPMSAQGNAVLTEQDSTIVYAYCERMIQLMENVYLDLQLEVDGDHVDNLGWMELFRHWASHPIMQSAWERSKETFGKRFAKFWQDLQNAPRSSGAPSYSSEPWRLPAET